jgi:hypothetical protein
LQEVSSSGFSFMVRCTTIRDKTIRLEGESQGVSDWIGISPQGQTPSGPHPLFFATQTVYKPDE